MNIKIPIPLLVILGLTVIAILIESFVPGVPDSPEDSDVIVILGGGAQGRMQKAALYESRYADKIFMMPAGDRYNAEELTSIARHYDGKKEVIIVNTESTSTYSNAKRTIEIMEEYNFESVMIITSDYHLKRAKLIFERFNDEDKIFNYISSANLDGKERIDKEKTPFLCGLVIL